MVVKLQAPKGKKIVIFNPKVKRSLKKIVTPSTFTPQRRVTRKGSKVETLIATKPKKGLVKITKIEKRMNKKLVVKLDD